MKSKKPKIIIVWFAHDLHDPRIIHACTDKGQQLTLTKCVVPEKRRCKCPLYSDGNRHFFSLSRNGLSEVFDRFSPTHRIPGRHCHNGKRGNDYPKMREFGDWYCHIIVLLTFQGERPIGDDGIPFEGDHKNGCVTDYSNDNLEWVPRKENRRRSKVLKALRSINVDPVQVPYKILDVFLDKKIVSDLKAFTSRLKKLLELMPHCLILSPDDFRRWLSMPDSDFDQMTSKYHRDTRTTDEIMQSDMSHHMEI